MVPEPSGLKPEKQEVLGIQVVVGSDEHGEASFEVAEDDQATGQDSRFWMSGSDGQSV